MKHLMLAVWRNSRAYLSTHRVALFRWVMLPAIGFGAGYLLAWIFHTPIAQPVRMQGLSRWIRIEVDTAAPSFDQVPFYADGLGMLENGPFHAVLLLHDTAAFLGAAYVKANPGTKEEKPLARSQVELINIEPDSGLDWFALDLDVDSVGPTGSVLIPSKDGTGWEDHSSQPLGLLMPAGNVVLFSFASVPAVASFADGVAFPSQLHPESGFSVGQHLRADTGTVSVPQTMVLSFQPSDNRAAPPALVIKGKHLTARTFGDRFVAPLGPRGEARFDAFSAGGRAVMMGAKLSVAGFRDPFTLAVTPQDTSGSTGVAILGGARGILLETMSGIMAVGERRVDLNPIDRVILRGNLGVGIEFKRGREPIVRITGKAEAASLNGKGLLPTRWKSVDPDFRTGIMGALVALLTGVLLARLGKQGPPGHVPGPRSNQD